MVIEVKNQQKSTVYNEHIFMALVLLQVLCKMFVCLFACLFASVCLFEFFFSHNADKGQTMFFHVNFDHLACQSSLVSVSLSAF